MRRVIKSLKVTIVLILVVFSCYMIYIRQLWSNIVTDDELREFVTEIKESDKVPEKFYYYYDKLYPNALEVSSNRLLFSNLFSNRTYKSPSQIMSLYYYRYEKGKRNRLKEFQFSLGWKLEREGVTQKECLNLLLKNQGYLFRVKGIKNASQYYFKKELDSLDNKQIATLVLMTKNPRMYNAKREISKKKLEEELKRLLD